MLQRSGLLRLPLPFEFGDVSPSERDLDGVFQDGRPFHAIGELPEESQYVLKAHFEQFRLPLLQQREHDPVCDLPPLVQEAVPHAHDQVEPERAGVLGQQPLCREHGDVDVLPVQVFGQSGQKEMDELFGNEQYLVRLPHPFSEQPPHLARWLGHDGCVYSPKTRCGSIRVRIKEFGTVQQR